MTRIEFNCDRCEQHVSGLFMATGTAGFYNVAGPNWKTFAREGETFVCDACVQSMPEYQAIYGSPAPVPAVVEAEQPE